MILELKKCYINYCFLQLSFESCRFIFVFVLTVEVLSPVNSRSIGFEIAEGCVMPELSVNFLGCVMPAPLLTFEIHIGGTLTAGALTLVWIFVPTSDEIFGTDEEVGAVEVCSGVLDGFTILSRSVVLLLVEFDGSPLLALDWLLRR